MFSEEAITNLISLNELCAKYHVTFNNKKENAFIIQLDNNRKIKFPVNEQGLYTYCPLSSKDSAKNHELVHAVMSRIRSAYKKTHVEGYMPREVQQAKEARRLYHSLTVQEVGEPKLFI